MAGRQGLRGLTITGRRTEQSLVWGSLRNARQAGRQAQLAPRLQASRRWGPVSFGTPLHSCKAEASKILELRTD